MRHPILRLFFLLITGLFTLNACNNDNSADPTQSLIENNAKEGTWRIISFVDSGNDETNHFSGYSFDFGNNDLLSATNGTNTYNGTWNVTDSNSGDDSLDDIDFNIAFNQNNDFEELTEDWQIVSQSTSRLELIHVSGGNGGTDYLTFEKI